MPTRSNRKHNSCTNRLPETNEYDRSSDAGSETDLTTYIGGEPPASKDGAANREATQLAWQIPKEELEAALEFADKSGRFKARTARA